MRPHVADAEAYTTEQEAWRTWNDMHLSAEAQVKMTKSIGRWRVGAKATREPVPAEVDRARV